jgi:hypothetical protein
MATATTTGTLTVEIKGVDYDVEYLGSGPGWTKGYRLTKRLGRADVYDVVRTDSGLVHCDCPHYRFRLEGNGFGLCKHGEALVSLGMLAAPRGADGPEADATCPECWYPRGRCRCPRG